MKVLFVVYDLFFSENLGPMTLSAICKEAGHETKMHVIRTGNLTKVLDSFQPDIVGYSAMTADMPSFRETDKAVLAWAGQSKRKITRILGGAHATFFPEEGERMDLDAVVVGEGDYAIMNIIRAVEEGRDLTGIANVIPRGGTLEEMKKEIVQDLDALPFIDRQIFYDAAPHLRYFKLRSVKIGRGCPFRCTYCHNHIFNRLFSGSGKIIRRRSIDNIIAELKYIIANYGPVGQIRFGDDTLIYKVDDWARAFFKRYKEEINLPFYCLLRSNVVTEEMVKLLAEAGCYSVSISLESGTEEVRNRVLKRGITDEVAKRSFALLRKYKIGISTNSLLALPGGTIEDDLKSFVFEKAQKASLSNFSIWTPFPHTELTDYALERGDLAKDYRFDNYFADKSALNIYSNKEKDMQFNIVKLGPLFSDLPDLFLPVFYWLIKRQPNRILNYCGDVYVLFKYFWSMFMPSVSRNPIVIMKSFFASFTFLRGK